VICYFGISTDEIQNLKASNPKYWVYLKALLLIAHSLPYFWHDYRCTRNETFSKIFTLINKLCCMTYASVGIIHCTRMMTKISNPVFPYSVACLQKFVANPNVSISFHYFTLTSKFRSISIVRRNLLTKQKLTETSKLPA